jgi:hypothetical protein
VYRILVNFFILKSHFVALFFLPTKRNYFVQFLESVIQRRERYCKTLGVCFVAETKKEG